MRAKLAAFSFFTGLLAAFGQPVPGEPEVRRALPVNTPAPTENPAWMEGVQPSDPPVPVARP
ncbi:MAG: hypothetical protein WCH98_10960, partial [Verrucomicrobiota bacterium]